MKKLFFCVAQIISILIEYYIIFLLLYSLFKVKFIISLIISLGILLFMTIVSLFSTKLLEKVDDEEDLINRLREEEINKLIDYVNNKYHLHVKLFYLSAPQPNPAWAVGSNIFINTKYPLDSDYIMGVVAHELGHQVSGICKLAPLASIKISNVLSKIFLFIGMLFNNQDNIFGKIFQYFFFFIYIVLSLNNIIFTYPFLNEDEYFANKFSIECGYSDDLRSYYALGIEYKRTALEDLIDLSHPTINQMLKRLEEDMKLPKEEKFVFSAGGRLIYTNQETVTLTLPLKIKEIKNCSIKGDKLIKLKGENVEIINSNSFMDCPNLEELILPNVNRFSVSSIRYLKNLKEIKINDDNINLDIIRTYYGKNVKFMDKLIKKVAISKKLTVEEIINSLQIK